MSKPKITKAVDTALRELRKALCTANEAVDALGWAVEDFTGTIGEAEILPDALKIVEAVEDKATEVYELCHDNGDLYDAWLLAREAIQRLIATK